MLRSLLCPRVGGIQASVPVRYAANRPSKKKASSGKKLTPKEQKRREMLVLLGRSAVLDLENKPKKEYVPLSHIEARGRMKPVVVPSDIEDERHRIVMAQSHVQDRMARSQRNEMLQAMDCRLKALGELEKLSESLYMFATSMRRRDFPYSIDELPETPPLPNYSPPEVSLEGKKAN